MMTTSNHARPLVLCGHPNLSASNFSRGVLAALDETVFDVHLLARQPAGESFDPRVELSLIERASVLIVLFPVHWYGPPSLLVRWAEEALRSVDGADPARALNGKEISFWVSAGGAEEEYTKAGKNERGLQDYLSGLQMTFRYFVRE